MALVAAVRARVGPTVVRATFSPTVALLLLLVASLLADHIVLFCYCATRCCSAQRQHGCCWQVLVCLSVTNSSVTVHLAQASSLDVLVLVGEVTELFLSYHDKTPNGCAPR